MKMILVGVLVVVSAGSTAAQSSLLTGRRAVIARSTTGATVEFDGLELRENVLYARNVSVTIGDLVLMADEATLETEMKLGSNARVILPSAESAQSNERPCYLIPVSTTRYTIPVSTTGATVQFDGRDWPETVTTVQNAILTFGDLVVRADEATLEKTEIRLGANARLILPARR